MPPCHTGEEAYGKKDDVLLRKKVQIVSIAKPIPFLRNGERKEAPVRCGWTARAPNSALSRSGRVLARVGAFLQGLAQSGWTIGRNVRIDTRWATANADDIRRHAAELAALAPDVILAHGTSTVASLLQATRTVPIVFTALSDPVAAGFVDSLARPGGNATGFMNFEFSLSGKWLELLKQIAPGVTRAAAFP
jgi:ABC transporter substrate binding protein